MTAFFNAKYKKMSVNFDPNKKTKSSYVLSCLGSLRKRKSSLEGKLRAMFTREKVGDWTKFVTVRGKNTAAAAAAENRLPDSDEDDDEDYEMSEAVTRRGEEKREGQDVTEKEETGPEVAKKGEEEEKETTGGEAASGVKKYGKRGSIKRNRRKKRRKSAGVGILSKSGLSVAKEVFANARITSSGDLSARVGKKFL